jgi:hypothetical protein
MDKNGNWKIMMNLSLQINVETLPGMWDASRNVFLTLQFKMKLTEVDGELVFHPKNIEMT